MGQVCGFLLSDRNGQTCRLGDRPGADGRGRHRDRARSARSSRSAAAPAAATAAASARGQRCPEP